MLPHSTCVCVCLVLIDHQIHTDVVIYWSHVLHHSFMNFDLARACQLCQMLVQQWAFPIHSNGMCPYRISTHACHFSATGSISGPFSINPPPHIAWCIHVPMTHGKAFACSIWAIETRRIISTLLSSLSCHKQTYLKSSSSLVMLITLFMCEFHCLLFWPPPANPKIAFLAPTTNRPKVCVSETELLSGSYITSPTILSQNCCQLLPITYQHDIIVPSQCLWT